MTGSSNTDGLCTIVNPYEENSKVTDYLLFASSHPQLPLYDQNGELVRDSGLVEVELQHQYEPQDEDYFEWRDCTKSFYGNIIKTDSNYKNLEPTRTRQIYRLLTVSQTEENSNMKKEGKIIIFTVLNKLDLSEEDKLIIAGLKKKWEDGSIEDFWKLIETAYKLGELKNDTK